VAAEEEGEADEDDHAGAASESRERNG